MATGNEQVCKKCRLLLPSSSFYENEARCKECERKRAADYRARNPEKAKASIANWQAKNPDYFANYRKENRSQCTGRVLKWRTENPDAYRASLVRYWTENKEKLKEQHARYYNEHREEVREYHQQRVALGLKKEDSRRWSALNKPKRAADERRRTAIKLNATPVWSEAPEIVALYQAAECLSLLTATQWDVDHIVPLRGVNVCGLHVLANLQLLPHIENVRKSNKWACA